jgi:membrane protein YqaA with SNARE-associated domain
VNELKDLDNPELKKIFRKHIFRGLFFLLLLIALIFILALSFEPQLKSSADWLTQKFGILGIGFVVFVTDLIVSPIPPDAFLFIIGKSQLHSQWILWVPILGFISSIAGVCGWLIGKKLEHLKTVKRLLIYLGNEHHEAIKKFGFWILVLGALTPLPFSITCWLSGIFKLPFKSVFTACLLRIPRFIIYYWAIFYSGEVGSLLRNFL